MKPTKKDLIKCVVYTLLYLLFLVLLAMPIMVMEFAVGRASRQAVAGSFKVLEPRGSRWSVFGYLAMAGNDGAQSYGLGRRDRLCLGGCLLSQSIFLSKLRHPFFFFGEDDAHGRLPFSK